MNDKYYNARNRSFYGPKRIGVIVVVLLLLIFWHVAMRGLRGGREVTLAECTNTVTMIHFKTERGQYFQLKFTTKLNSPSEYPGRVHIVNAVTKQTADFNTDSNYFYIIPKDSILQPDSDYEMTVTFPPKAKPAMAITLQWVQRVRDRGK